MGWIIDLVAAFFVLMIGLYIAYKFGITFGDMEMYFKHFFGSLIFGDLK